MTSGNPSEAPKKKRQSGIPTGNAGEYFVMGELLRRGFDAQLADRNTAGYDLLVGKEQEKSLTKVQVKTVRATPWYIRKSDFQPGYPIEITIYVLLGKVDAKAPVRFFIARNSAIAANITGPATWEKNAFVQLKFIEQFENNWDLLNQL